MWWVRSDCCGVICSLITILLMFYAAFVQVYYVIGPWKGYFSSHVILYIFLVILSAASHTKCQFSNPGTVPIQMNEEEDPNVLDPEGSRWCRKCKRTKPYDASHCSACGRCIIRMDHHCPWVNNCVALFNQKYFLQFLLYTGIQCLFCLVSLSSRFFICTNQASNSIRYNRSRHYRMSAAAAHMQQQQQQQQLEQLQEWEFDGINAYCDARPIDILLCVLNFIEGILFGLFTFIMLFDQLSSIFENTPYIAKLKGKKGIKKTKYECLQLVFGEPFHIRWFFPTPLTSKIEKDHSTYCAFFGR